MCIKPEKLGKLGIIGLQMKFYNEHGWRTQPLCSHDVAGADSFTHGYSITERSIVDA